MTQIEKYADPTVATLAAPIGTLVASGLVPSEWAPTIIEIGAPLIALAAAIRAVILRRSKAAE